MDLSDSSRDCNRSERIALREGFWPQLPNGALKIEMNKRETATKRKGGLANRTNRVRKKNIFELPLVKS
jgi:hypothetical protein